ncbi:MAG: outer membrane lipoprotein LolB, partial [Betaproteobacteria bacterium]|nr:outer membrane lipoprotein LolB [Betaproteobacteria bacterium]
MAAAVLAGCAALPPAPTAPGAASVADLPFAVDGRLSARHGEDGVAGAFTWSHEPGRDSIDLSTPLGQT